MEKQYYNYKDVKTIVHCCSEKAYKLIQKLNNEMKEEYPNMYILEKRIPIWYWNKRMNPYKEEMENGKNI